MTDLNVALASAVDDGGRDGCVEAHGDAGGQGKKAESSQPSSATMVTSVGLPSLVVSVVRARVSFNMALKIPMRPRRSPSGRLEFFL